MFYFLSKLLLFLIQPAVWIIGLVLLALVSKSGLRRKRRLIFALVFFFIFGNTGLFNAFAQRSETFNSDQSAISSKKPYAIVLGGYGEYDHRTGRMEFHEAADRLTESMKLYHAGQIDYIICSSGMTNGAYAKTEGELSRDFLIKTGIPAEHVFAEGKSINTYTNAVYSAVMVDSLKMGRDGFLITSAFHMHRAMDCFDKQGFNLTPLPVDYISKDHSSFIDWLWPSMHTVLDWELLIKERVGRVVYSLKGYT